MSKELAPGSTSHLLLRVREAGWSRHSHQQLLMDIAGICGLHFHIRFFIEVEIRMHIWKPCTAREGSIDEHGVAHHSRGGLQPTCTGCVTSLPAAKSTLQGELLARVPDATSACFTGTRVAWLSRTASEIEMWFSNSRSKTNSNRNNMRQC